MSKDLIAVEGLEELTGLIRKLPEKTKRKEVLQLMGQVANPTLKAMRNFAPIGSVWAHTRYTGVKKGRRRAKGTVPDGDKTVYLRGHGRQSIRKKTMKRSRVPMITVGAHSFGKKYDGFYMRNWVNKGTKLQTAQPFVDEAYRATKGAVTKDFEIRMARYIQRKINKLN